MSEVSGRDEICFGVDVERRWKITGLHALNRATRISVELRQEQLEVGAMAAASTNEK